jgi:hypothetical protein
MKRHLMDKEGLAAELAALPSFDRQQLLQHWRTLYGVNAPVKISQQLLIRAIAYKLQEQVLGGLKPATRKLLAAVLEGNGKQAITSAAIKPGTRLIREWHGRIHEVIIAESRVEYDGKSYRSLSEVAHVITGVKWSGPAFFGLKAKKGAMAA